MERRATDVARNRSKRPFCSSCWDEQRRTDGARPRSGESKYWRQIQERTHNGQPVRLDHDGYIWIYEPAFKVRNSKQAPRLHRRQGFHPEHRVVASRMLGRPLRRDEHVHHINGIKTDNRPENLQVMSQQAHRKLHNDEIAEKLARLADYERRFGPLDTDRDIGPQPAAADPLIELKTKGVH
jgi:hypothetical protein